MIIDIHSHCFPDGLASRAIAALTEKAGIPAYTDGTVRDLKRSMITAGIDMCVIQHIATKPEQTANVNRWAVEIQDAGIIGFGSIHPDYQGWREEIKWLVGSGIKGVKFHPEYQDFYVDDPKVYPIYEALFEAGLTVLFHAGVDLGFPYPYHCTPSRLAKVLDSFLGSRMIAAHMGGYRYWKDVERYLLGKDIYLDTSFAFNDLGAETMLALIKGHGVDRILFGSDSPWTDQWKEVSNIKSLDLSGEEIASILGGNAVHLLSI
jgi:hypothetical protein